jgi:hypothetical protein
VNRQNADVITIGGFLVGLGFLLLTDWFWLGILLLVGLVSLVNLTTKGEIWTTPSARSHFSVPGPIVAGNAQRGG